MYIRSVIIDLNTLEVTNNPRIITSMAVLSNNRIAYGHTNGYMTIKPGPLIRTWLFSMITHVLELPNKRDILISSYDELDVWDLETTEHKLCVRTDNGPTTSI